MYESGNNGEEAATSYFISIIYIITGVFASFQLFAIFFNIIKCTIVLLLSTLIAQKNTCECVCMWMLYPHSFSFLS